MFHTLFTQSIAVLRSNLVANEPGRIVGPIATIFGYIIDIIFSIVHTITLNHSLGISIIILTIIVRFLMLPMGIKQQQSMLKMQKLNPELKKIKAKYGNSKDPEIVKKMNTEQQALYAKNKVNPLSGCLPLLITMPLFLGLIPVMRESYRYVTPLRDTYSEISSSIMQITDGGRDQLFYTNYFAPLADVVIPDRMKNDGTLSMDNEDDMSRVISKFNNDDWHVFLYESPVNFPQDEYPLAASPIIQSRTRDQLPPINTMPQYAAIRENLDKKNAIEHFIGLPLNYSTGWRLPSIIIPILVGITTFSSSWVSSKMSANADEKQKSQQKIMMYVMPALMTFMTVNLPGGVGIYWTASSMFQTGQQIFLNRRSGIPLFKPKDDIIDVK